MNNEQKTESREHSISCSMLHARCSMTGGFTLFYSLILISLLVALGLAIFNITYKQLILSSGVRNSAQAFYAADTGLECALFWDLKYTGISSPAFGFYGDSLASGLAGYWRFDDGSGSDEARDFSGRGNDGELTNMDEDLAWVDGHIGGGALEFDGVDDVVEAPSAPVTGSGDRTVTFWVYPYGTLGSGVFDHIVEWGEGGPGKRYTVALTTNNVVRVEMNGGATYSYTSGLSAPQDGWSFVAVVLDGNTIGDHTFYTLLDGNKTPQQENASGGGVVNTGSGNGVHIGDTFMTGVGERKFHGMIDDVRVYNRALSQAEVYAIARKESNIIFTDPIEANTPGVTCGGALITDPTNGWSVATSTDAATTVFDLELPDERCASIEVAKDTSTTTIISRGYSSCNVDDPRRVERAIRAEY